VKSLPVAGMLMAMRGSTLAEDTQCAMQLHHPAKPARADRARGWGDSGQEERQLCPDGWEGRTGLVSGLLDEATRSPVRKVYLDGSDFVNFACRYNASKIPASTIGLRTAVSGRLDRHDLPALAQCTLCGSEGAPRKPVLFIPERKDGLGARARQLLHGMALASYLGFRFGGMVPNQSQRPHGLDATQILSNTLGLDVGALHVPADTGFDICFDSWLDFFSGTLQQSCLQWLPQARLMVASYDFLQSLPVWKWEPRFLERLRQQTPLHGLPVQHFRGPRLKVVMHVRRGDLVGHKILERTIPDEVYFHLNHQIRDLLPEADVHVFSTTEEANETLDFTGYHERKMHVHLDGDAVDDLAHMAQAHVFFMGPSAFSWVAALFSQGCVLAFVGSEALPDWILHKGTLDEVQSGRLRRCLQDRDLLSS